VRFFLPLLQALLFLGTAATAAAAALAAAPSVDVTFATGSGPWTLFREVVDVAIAEVAEVAVAEVVADVAVSNVAVAEVAKVAILAGLLSILAVQLR
jgi:hypothetical protein